MGWRPKDAMSAHDPTMAGEEFGATELMRRMGNRSRRQAMNDETVQWTVSSGERAELKRGAGRDCDGVWVRDFPGCARPKTLSRGRAWLRHFVRAAP